MSKFEKSGGQGQSQSQGQQPSVLIKSSTGKIYCDWKNAEGLRRCMSPNGKILGRKRSGFSAYEQRLVSQAIKRARYMGLLPFTSATL